MPENSRLTIAIVLISYNQQDYIIEALDGIRSQTREPDEVVIADDGSTDNTQKIIREYVKTHNLVSKWLLLLSPTNRGINENLQNAIEQTTSEIIIGMAGDDVSLENRCIVTEKLFLECQGALLISTSGFIIDNTGALKGEVNYNDTIVNNVYSVIKRGYVAISPIGHAARRELYYKYGRLPLNLPNEDDQISFRGIISGGIKTSSIKTFKYRVHASSASSWLRANKGDEKFFERFRQDLKVREMHMHQWKNCLHLSKSEGRELFSKLLDRKIEYYKELGAALESTILNRLFFLNMYKDIISKRDFVLIVFGRSGFHLLNTLRSMFK